MFIITTYYLGNVQTTTVNISCDDPTSLQVMYNSERKETNIHDNNKPNWKGKIGLLYPSDHGYSEVTRSDFINICLYDNQSSSNRWLGKNTPS